MAPRSSDTREQRVLLLTPTPRDGELARLMLAEAGIVAEPCPDLPALLVELEAPVGAIMITEESLAEDGIEALRAWVDAQPAWSDLPILVLVRGGANSATAEVAVDRLGNVTLLERPLRVATLLSAVRSALRGRRRQYQIREHLLERIRSNELLESRVAERTAVAEQRASQLRSLASELAQAEMRERRRLAQVLHDHLQQLLVAARLSLRMALARVDDGAREPLQRADDLISETIEESRSLTVELSPPILYEGGLGPALAWLGRWMGEKHALRVDLEADPAAEPESEQARVLLFQAVRELLFNIVKHACVEAAKVELQRAEDGGVRIRVSDRGAGFDPELCGRGGDHFGLLSIRERLQVLGGDFGVKSAPGSGTVVTLNLPLITAPVEVSRRIPRPAGAAQGPLASTTDSEPAHRETSKPEQAFHNAAAGEDGRISVLLVDDHEILRKGLAGLLADEPDIRVVAEACDGLEAVELAERLRPDVVVMDVTMPGLTGVEATRRIADRLPGVRVIGLSMHSEQDMATAMRAAGAAAYLTKGGSATALIDCIKTLARTGSAAACAEPARSVAR